MKTVTRPDEKEPSCEIGSYWEATAGERPEDPAFAGDAQFDAAVIGAGYAGLSAALRLAREGLSVCVLDAKQVGWGASGRNGGFCCFGGSKLSEPELVTRFGLSEAQRFVRYQIEAIDAVAERLDSWGLDADRHSDGEIILAHRASDFESFQEGADYLAQNFGYRPKVLTREELIGEGISGPEFFGGFHLPHGFALHPMKYVQRLAVEVRKAGVRIFGRSPVTKLERERRSWRLHLPESSLKAKKVFLAGNGYTDETISPWLRGRTLPVMSSVFVTRPLSDDELAAQGWTSNLMAADTRILLHYFRLLPDRRFLFGTRGGIFESPSSLKAMYQHGRADFDRMFPAWKGVETDYAWYGHVCLARNLTAFVGAVPEMEGVYAAMAWHGSGIAMASHSGEKVAELALGKIAREDLPAAITVPLKTFPLPALRNAYLQSAYWLYGWMDR